MFLLPPVLMADKIDAVIGKSRGRHQPGLPDCRDVVAIIGVESFYQEGNSVISGRFGITGQVHLQRYPGRKAVEML